MASGETNASAIEIKQHMMHHKEAQNRAYLIVGVFHAKLEQFKKEIFKNEIFGNVVAYTYVVEFQKREYDEIVSAEIPNERSNPHLFRMVVKYMLHGPCGDLNPKNVCMKKKGYCKNFYPKAFCDVTTQNNDAYPAYRRRDNGVKVIVRGAKLDNRWVVPYNPYLLCKFDCNVNIEICSTIKAVKYIYKYTCKGCDKISRWISPQEAAWRIFEFSLGEIKPTVIHLPLHLENYQSITFKKKEQLTNIKNNANRFFLKNTTNRYAQHLNLTYVDFLDHFIWKPNNKVWLSRKTEDSIGRIVCPKSYDDLKLCKGQRVDTFRESALLHGYLLDDNSQQLCLEEASSFHMPYELQRLFATLLVYTNPNNPRKLWESFEDVMLEDFVHYEKDQRAIQNLNKKQKLAFDTIIRKVETCQKYELVHMI
uniref:Helitron helicase-like domain-containing protein n=1 Tax=Lactuca sativa TaxID=4236 RepID=A0A9R1WRD1_LACSA|nr:hypothetical protein LSAT_V11C900473150 [Lactuca sativa]